ncbi:MAG TPA: energy-coupling factor ABC transporter permease [Verrucomicrobiae bacterium]|nr:energy-coupling factor ABC transporter permease [Verrucomicrobiae bacterium]
MHIPDGFLDGKTVAVTATLAAVGVGLALSRVRRTLPQRKIPLLGLSAAFLFAAQMLNFPVLAGTSGHLIGGVLVAALLGPGAAVVVVTTVLIVQCFLFQDGGVLALGANVLNMALVGAGGGWAVHRVVSGLLPGERGRVAAVAFAGWLSTVLAAMTCAGELAWSGRVHWKTAFTAMAGIHLLIGLGEGLISALVFAAIQRTRPEILDAGNTTDGNQRWGEFVRYGFLAALGLALFVAPFACPWPDGLETVAAKLGLAPVTTEPQLPALAPDYAFPGVHSAPVATALAGAVGSVIVFALALLLARVLVPKRTEIAPAPRHQS